MIKFPNRRIASTTFLLTSTWKPLRYKEIPKINMSGYLQLAKVKLSALVVSTAVCGYAMSPGEFSLATLCFATIGTGLCASSANIINQLFESSYDAQMTRTRIRPLVLRSITPFQTFKLGTGFGLLGVFSLSLTSPMAGLLGLTNILLYTLAYTPMKRTSIYNTWVGALVGALPPLIGWTASTGSIDIQSLILASALFSWQFPHFNALSWNLRSDYAKAGFKMMSVLDPNMNCRVALRHSVLLFPISLCAPIFGLTSWWFLFGSTAINSFMLQKAFIFYYNPNEKSARGLFMSSLWHLPILLTLFVISKKKEPITNKK